MAAPPMSAVSHIITSLQQGESRRSDQLIGLVYDELRRLANRYLSSEKRGQTLQATALVHEAWLKLMGPDGEALSWRGRRHFFCAAARAMRRILIDTARRKVRPKHGGNLVRVELGDVEATVSSDFADLMDLDAALKVFAQSYEKEAQVADLRLFAGLTLKEISAAMGTCETTTKKRWAFAQAWLTRALGS